MTPDQPTSPDGKPKKPPHRANLENLAKDTTEQDLWDFGDEEETQLELPAKKPKLDIPVKQAAGKAAKKPPEKVQRSVPKLTPIHDDLDDEDFEEPAKTGPAEPIRPKRTGTAVDSISSSLGEIDDDDDWDLNSNELPTTPQAELPDEKSFGAKTEEAPTPSETAVSEDPLGPRNGGENRKKPAFKISLTKGELISFGVLLLMLIAGGIFFFANSLNRIPAPPAALTADDFPIKGKQFTVVKAETFWRKPIVNGDALDNVRRGTLLIPVLNLTSEGGSGAVRVIFRDSDGKSVGDVISRSVSGNDKIEIAATAGFEDMSVHAAYRTGDIKPWIVEVHQGPAVNAPGDAYSKLFEIPISIQLHED